MAKNKTTISNKSASTLVLPNGVAIPAGRTVEVENFDQVENHDVVKAWFDAGALVEGDASGDDADASGDERKGPAADHNRFTPEQIAMTSGAAPIGATANELGGDAQSKPWGQGDNNVSTTEQAPKEENQGATKAGTTKSAKK